MKQWIISFVIAIPVSLGIVTLVHNRLEINSIMNKYEKCLDDSMLLPTDLCGCAEEVYLEDHFDGNPDSTMQRNSFLRCVRQSDLTDQAICDCAQQVGRPDWCD